MSSYGQGEGGVLEMMMVDDLGGGVGVQKRPFCDDVICEQPLIEYTMSLFTYHNYHSA